VVRSRLGFRPGGSTVRPEASRRPARPRHPCAGSRTAGPSRAQRGCGPPRTRSGGFPRFSILLASPEPRPQFRLADRFSGSGSPRRVRRGGMVHGWWPGIKGIGGNPQIPRGFPQSCQRPPQVRPQECLKSVRVQPQVTRTAPANRAPRAARPPRAPVAPRSAGLFVAEWIAAAAPDSPTRRSFTRRALR